MESRLVELDYLRGIAILLVLGRHFHTAPDISQPLKGVLQLWERAGGIGVDLFFCLSGFLISGLLFAQYDRHGKFRLRRFYIRRAFKLYPAFLVLLGVTVAKSIWAGDFSFARLWPELTFLQNYFEHICSQTWSLAVEEHFYLALPLLLIGLTKWPKTAVDRPFRYGWTFALPMLFCLVLRLLRKDEPFSYLVHVLPTPLRIDALFFGVFLRWSGREFPQETARFVHHYRFFLLALVILGLLPNFLWELEGEPFLYTYGFTLNTLAFGSAILLLRHQRADPRPTLRLPAEKLIANIGVYSYSIYLWHLAVRYLVAPGGQHAAPLGTIKIGLYLMVAVGMGIGMTHLIEFPALKIRQKYFPDD